MRFLSDHALVKFDIMSSRNAMLGYRLSLIKVNSFIDLRVLPALSGNETLSSFNMDCPVLRCGACWICPARGPIETHVTECLKAVSGKSL
jgi:hypothetical protein